MKQSERLEEDVLVVSCGPVEAAVEWTRVVAVRRLDADAASADDTGERRGRGAALRLEEVLGLPPGGPRPRVARHVVLGTAAGRVAIGVSDVAGRVRGASVQRHALPLALRGPSIAYASLVSIGERLVPLVASEERPEERERSSSAALARAAVPKAPLSRMLAVPLGRRDGLEHLAVFSPEEVDGVEDVPPLLVLPRAARGTAGLAKFRRGPAVVVDPVVAFGLEPAASYRRAVVVRAGAVRVALGIRELPLLEDVPSTPVGGWQVFGAGLTRSTREGSRVVHMLDLERLITPGSRS